MAGFMPAIHVLLPCDEGPKTWMPGTSPGMTRITEVVDAESIYFFAGMALPERPSRPVAQPAPRRLAGLSMRSILAVCAQLGDVVGLRLAHHIVLDLGLHLIEIRRLAVALFLDLDDVPAELRLHGLGDLAGLQREGDGGEFRHHLVLGEEAEIAAIGGARVLRFLLGEFGEVGALVSSALICLASSSVSHQDVAGMDFLFAGDLLGGVLVDLLHGVVGHRRLAFDGQQVVHQQPVAREGETAA